MKEHNKILCCGICNNFIDAFEDVEQDGLCKECYIDYEKALNKLKM